MNYQINHNVQKNKSVINIETDVIVFLTGAAGYSLTEILFRGYTHWSMGIAGGICFTFFSRNWEKLKSLPKIYIPVFGSMVITAVEFAFGLIFNLGLKENVWDYSGLPFNFMGQICVLFSCLWGFLCIPVIPAAGFMRKKLLCKF